MRLNSQYESFGGCPIERNEGMGNSAFNWQQRADSILAGMAHNALRCLEMP